MTTSRPRILIVDDNEGARDAIEALLHKDEYQFDFAKNGHEALALLSSSPPDLIICDVMMPGMDGFEVCRAVKAHPQWRFVPLILVTALDGQDDLVRGIEVGADDFLSKPVEKVLLRTRVRAMLRVRAQYQQLRSGAPDLESLLRDRRDQLATKAGLTPREREVLNLLLIGRTHEDIGTALGISARTSKFHLEQLLKKLGVESRNDLLRLFL